MTNVPKKITWEDLPEDVRRRTDQEAFFFRQKGWSGDIESVMRQAAVDWFANGGPGRVDAHLAKAKAISDATGRDIGDVICEMEEMP